MKTICELQEPNSQPNSVEANLANASVLIKVKFFADVEAYSIIFGIPVSEANKRESDRHICRTVLWDTIGSQAVGQRYQAVHALAGVELCLYFVATAGRFAA